MVQDRRMMKMMKLPIVLRIVFLLKTNRKSYVLYRMALFSMTLGDPNHPKPPNFQHFAIHFIFSKQVKIDTSNVVGRFILAFPT